MNRIEGLKVLAAEPIQGAAEFVENRPNVDEDALALELEVQTRSNNVALPAARGLGEVFTNMVRAIRGRTLVENLGEHEFSVDWLTFHVPSGGKGYLQMENAQGAKFGLGLGFVGLGYGSGFHVTISVNQDFHERTNCLHLSHRILAQVLKYTDNGSNGPAYLQLNVLKLLSSQMTEIKECAECNNTGPTAKLLLKRGAAIDLTADPVGLTREETLSLNNDSELEIGLPFSLANMKLKPTVVVNRSIHLECKVRYVFPGGYCFTPARKPGSWNDFPFWRRTVKCQ